MPLARPRPRHSCLRPLRTLLPHTVATVASRALPLDADAAHRDLEPVLRADVYGAMRAELLAPELLGDSDRAPSLRTSLMLPGLGLD